MGVLYNYNLVGRAFGPRSVHNQVSLKTLRLMSRARAFLLHPVQEQGWKEVRESTDLEAGVEKPRFIIPDDASGKVSRVTDGIFSALQGGELLGRGEGGGTFRLLTGSCIEFPCFPDSQNEGKTKEAPPHHLPPPSSPSNSSFVQPRPAPGQRAGASAHRWLFSETCQGSRYSTLSSPLSLFL